MQNPKEDIARCPPFLRRFPKRGKEREAGYAPILQNNREIDAPAFFK